MPSLRVHLLGSPRVELEGNKIKTDRRKAIALLAYLAVTAEHHTREALAAFFWPEHEPAKAFAYLRRTLWELNHVLGKGWLQTDQQWVAIRQTDDFWLDVRQFEALLASAEETEAGLGAGLQQAVTLYRGDFMAGFSLRDSPSFDDWQRYQCERLRFESITALSKLSARLEQSSAYDDALPLAKRWSTIDPLDEGALRQLMRLYALKGLRSEALRQYERASSRLREELGVEPEFETVALYEQLTDGRFPGRPKDMHLGAPVAHNLPTQLTTFIGRRKELAEIASLMAEPTCHLLTLVGPGGCGKTRLAIRAATLLVNQRVDHYPDGIYFVSLAAIHPTDSIVPALAYGLDFSFNREGGEPRQQLIAYLHLKRMLIVLDTFEHLLESADAQLPLDILSNAPGVNFLITSRANLNVRGEHLYHVAGLDVPETATAELTVAPREMVAAHSAIRLFEQSARRVKPDFRITAANLADVTNICRLVGGMPLGIELAAGWISMMSPAEIAAEVQRDLDFLHTEMRDVPRRQRSVRAIFDSSWKLLSEREQDAFRKLTVLQGSFSRDAAQAVTGASLPTMLALANKSWLQASHGYRYQIHELLRQYGREALQANPEANQAAHDIHAQYFADFLQEQGQSMRGRGQKKAFEAVAVDYENIRAAWLWLVEQNEFDTLIEKMLSGLIYFSTVRFMFAELVALVKQTRRSQAATDRDPNLMAVWLSPELWFQWDRPKADHQDRLRQAWAMSEKLNPETLLSTWYLLFLENFGWVVDRDKSIERLRQIIPELERSSDRWLTAFAITRLGELLFRDTDREEPKRLFDEALNVFEELGDGIQIAHVLQYLGFVAIGEAAYDEARRHLLAARDLLHNLNDLAGYARLNRELAELSLRIGDTEKAFSYFQEQREISAALGHQSGVVNSLHWESIQAARYSTLEHARKRRESALALAQELESWVEVAWSTLEMGEIYRLEGNYDEARNWFDDAYQLFDRYQVRMGFALCYRGLGDIALRYGSYSDARQYFRQYRQIAEERSEHWSVAHALCGLGRVEIGLENYDEARPLLHDSLRIAYDLGSRDLCMLPLVALARLHLLTGQTVLAAELATFVLDSPLSWNETRKLAAAVLGEASQQLSLEMLEKAKEKGRQNSLADLLP